MYQTEFKIPESIEPYSNSVEEMMNSDIISSLGNSLDVLKMKITEQEIAYYMFEREFSDLQMQAVSEVFEDFSARKEEASVNFLLKCSRLPMKNPKKTAMSTLMLLPMLLQPLIRLMKNMDLSGKS